MDRISNKSEKEEAFSNTKNDGEQTLNEDPHEMNDECKLWTKLINTVKDSQRVI